MLVFNGLLRVHLTQRRTLFSVPFSHSSHSHAFLPRSADHYFEHKKPWISRQDKRMSACRSSTHHPSSRQPSDRLPFYALSITNITRAATLSSTVMRASSFPVAFFAPHHGTSQLSSLLSRQFFYALVSWPPSLGLRHFYSENLQHAGFFSLI